LTELSQDPYASIVELSKSFRKKSLLPSDVVAAQLARIESLDPSLGSYQQVYKTAALKAAKLADTALAADQRIGPFHGVPFALKDIYDFAGHVTSCGSWEMRDRISSQTGSIAKRLLDAGGILLGKTKTVECALGGWGTNQHMGTPRNPWDLDHERVPGGSSSGSGVAVASGMAMCATGSDTGGSVRLPAAYCGLMGLKVSKACLPTDGIMPLSDTLDTPGPMARSVADLTLMFAVMSGVSSVDIDRDMAAAAGLFESKLSILKGLKVGILDPAERQVCSADILASYDAALDLLGSLGAKLEIFKAPAPYREMADANGAITIYEGYLHHHALYEDPQKQMDPHVRKRILTGRDMTAKTHEERLQKRQRDQADFGLAMEGFDALVTPTLIAPAPKLNDINEDLSPGHFTRPFNYIDMCALALPIAPSQSGLPTSLQIVAPVGQEAFTLKVGTALETVLNIVERPNLNRL
jgi:aspartyl-tRNA(Asn)/glutamyl-tRNA(Gln) amidotransferase subunit A